MGVKAFTIEVFIELKEKWERKDTRAKREKKKKEKGKRRGKEEKKTNFSRRSVDSSRKMMDLSCTTRLSALLYLSRKERRRGARKEATRSKSWLRAAGIL